ncbi:hypothetical protein H0H93_000828 [Arthromyces matolae]|nr:hypothetical protein H0H93_000828 [Arthromyces matolae]
MLSKQIVAVARGRGLLNSKSIRSTVAPSLVRGWNYAAPHTRVSKFHSSKLLEAVTVKVPTMAESITEGTLKSWSKQVGDSVAADEEIATIETDKIDVSVNAPQSGKIIQILAAEEDTVTVGQDLVIIEPGEVDATASNGAATESQPKDNAEPADQQVDKKLPEPPKPSEAETKPLEEKEPPKKEAPKKEKETAPTPRPAVGSRGETRVKMNRMRLRIAERLKESQNAAASLTTFNEIDMSSLIEMRKKYKDQVLKEHDVKLGYMSAFAKACTLALREIPSANASIEGEEIVYRDYVDLSVAVATPKGLVTPVVRNTETMGFVDIEKEIAALGKKARDGKLTLEDMAGGTFTISNGGVFGSLYGTPIINLPQSAVLGMHAIKDRAVVVDGQIVIRPIMVVALTYDHRLLDGREAVTFLVPVELLVQIVGHLHGDEKEIREALSKCSMVSRPFREICQARLFATIDLYSFNGTTRCQRLHRILTTSPHLSFLVRKLNVQNGWCLNPVLRMWAHTEPTFHQVLDMLPVLEELYLNSSATKPENWQDMGPALQASLLRLLSLPSLKNLRLRNVQLPSTIFLYTPQLQELGLFKSSFTPEDQLELMPSMLHDSIDGSVFPSAHTLSSRRKTQPHSFTLVPDFLRPYIPLPSTVDFSCLKKLDVSLMPLPSGSVLGPILDACWLSLIALELKVPRYIVFSSVEALSNRKQPLRSPSANAKRPIFAIVFPHVALPPNLRSLTLNIFKEDFTIVGTSEPFTLFTWALQAFRILDDKSILEVLTFEVITDIFPEMMSHPFWDCLDSAFFGDASLKSLPRIIVRVSEKLDRSNLEGKVSYCEPRISGRLPRLTASGVLQVEYLPNSNMI